MDRESYGYHAMLAVQPASLPFVPWFSCYPRDRPSKNGSSHPRDPGATLPLVLVGVCRVSCPCLRRDNEDTLSTLNGNLSHQTLTQCWSEGPNRSAFTERVAWISNWYGLVLLTGRTAGLILNCLCQQSGSSTEWQNYVVNNGAVPRIRPYQRATAIQKQTDIS